MEKLMTALICSVLLLCAIVVWAVLAHDRHGGVPDALAATATQAQAVPDVTPPAPTPTGMATRITASRSSSCRRVRATVTTDTAKANGAKWDWGRPNPDPVIILNGQWGNTCQDSFECTRTFSIDPGASAIAVGVIDKDLEKHDVIAPTSTVTLPFNGRRGASSLSVRCADGDE